MNRFTNTRRTVLFAVLAMMVLSGCITRYVDRVVVKTEYVVVAPEATYLNKTAVPAPPPKITYAPGERPDFEKLYKDQVTHSVELFKTVNTCNKDKYAAQQDILKKKKTYE